jgi:hypothetical protein
LRRRSFTQAAGVAVHACADGRELDVRAHASVQAWQWETGIIPLAVGTHEATDTHARVVDVVGQVVAQSAILTGEKVAWFQTFLAVVSREVGGAHAEVGVVVHAVEASPTVMAGVAVARFDLCFAVLAAVEIVTRADVVVTDALACSIVQTWGGATRIDSN